MPALWRMPRTCHTPGCSRDSNGHSRALPDNDQHLRSCRSPPGPSYRSSKLVIRPRGVQHNVLTDSLTRLTERSGLGETRETAADPVPRSARRAGTPGDPGDGAHRRKPVWSSTAGQHAAPAGPHIPTSIRSTETLASSKIFCHRTCARSADKQISATVSVQTGFAVMAARHRNSTVREMVDVKLVLAAASCGDACGKTLAACQGASRSLRPLNRG
jgi:hypothetical protein